MTPRPYCGRGSLGRVGRGQQPVPSPSSKPRSTTGARGRGAGARDASCSASEFPRSYDQVISECCSASRAALDDGVRLLEIEFPPLSLRSVCGDGEGSVEMDANLQHVTDISTNLANNRRAKDENLRVMFPDEDEMDRGVALKEMQSPNARMSQSFLTTPSFLGDVGLDPFKRPVREKISSEDSYYLCAYPSFSVNEMLTVEELRSEVPDKPIIVVNGELDRFRSGYYPKVFYQKVGAMSEAFIPQFEAVFYIHNFKGRAPGVLYRKYPGNWKVFRRGRDNEVVECIHEQDHRPTLREIALKYFA